LSPWLSDGLCRVATGGGVGKRTLYTDGDVTVIAVKRPIVVTGIADPSVRPDYLDRVLGVELRRIDDTGRRAERDLDAAFARDVPLMVGVLYDAVAGALRDWDATDGLVLPRMADAARWVAAASPALGWERDGFSRAMFAGRADASLTALEGSTLGQAILRVFGSAAGSVATEWSGTAQELLEEARRRMPDDVRALPKTARGVAEELKRLEPALFEQGIGIERHREAGSGQRRLKLLKGATK
jgi:putative DNA primase/helicase